MTPRATDPALASWAIAHLRREVDKLKASMSPEPTAEPERAFWHLSWNAGVDRLAFEAAAAYHAEQGREAPADLLPLLLRMLAAFHTNPYPGRMVIDVTVEHLAGVR
jgi:hypothetical protein